MRLRFKHQKFQEDATNAVCDVFAGQPNKKQTYAIDQGVVNNSQTQIAVNITGWKNEEMHLRPEDILKNLKTVQKQHRIPASQKLETLTSRIEWEDGRKESVTKPVFTIEMETGTGKTYVYIKTMYELNARYGWSKFIIVVPSIAIREGVAKTFAVTADHFKEDYGKQCRFFIYNSSRLNELEHFADDPGINVMIVNTQAFASNGKDNKRIYMKLDEFRSRRPIDVIAAVNPIVIVDEPQSVIGETGKKNVTRDSIGKFKPLFYINYSATHREKFNMVYKLDAVDAYQKQLVKKINVKGIDVQGTTATNGYLYLQRINTYPNKSPSATVVFEYNSANNKGVSKKVKTFKVGDNIYEHSGEIEAYREGYKIANIDARSGCVEFTNSRGDGSTTILLGQVIGDINEEDIRRIQIRETIWSHLEKERELYKKGIKVLSLFFIDEVAKYKYYDEAGEQKGVYAKIFEKEYKTAVDLFLSELPFEETEEFRLYLERDEPHRVHHGYFSVDKKGRSVDSEVKRGESESADVIAYDLIMKNKERLLSTDEPVRFIFSHSALREGWDNPNVFQICTLRMSSGEIKKRQEIGRGLRLCVNKHGERMDADVLGEHAVHDVNSLTVIANQSYDEFARTLQDELHEVIKNGPKEIAPVLFKGQIWDDAAGNSIEIDESKAALVFAALKMTGLVKDGQLTDEYHEMSPELRTEKIAEVLAAVDNCLEAYALNVTELIEPVYNADKMPLVHNDREHNKLHLDQEKFASKEFKELWSKINQKTYYTVSFDEEKLVAACVRSINKNLRVAQTLVLITEGYLESTNQQIPQMKKYKGREVVLEEIAANDVTFDLIGELALPTRLTRRTVASILQKIDTNVFGQFKKNPEAFIRECIRLINEQKASTVVEHISYSPLNDEWVAEDIFVDASISGKYGVNIRDAKKHIYDKVKYDSDVEMRLSEDLDIADSVKLYAKLPSGFFIHTPMGNYNPDWAIVFKENSVKHIYFVAETKGTVSEIQQNEIAKSKIDCAKKHFAKISNDTVKYDVIDSYQELLKLVNS